MEIAKEQKELLMKCMDSIDAVRIFRKLFWKWYEGPVRLLGESTRDQLRQLREFMCAEDKVGSDTMPYVMVMLYYGRDLAARKIALQKPNGDYYVLSVCEQLQSELDHYFDADDPYFPVFECRPDDLCDWLKHAVEIVDEANTIACYGI
jgi:hypothetical protein